MNSLPEVNAILNLTATLLLLLGYVLIKQGREQAHKITMLTAFVVSTLFLVSYLTYHYAVGHVKFTGPPPVSYFYYTILLTHIVLAVTVPVLALTTIYFGLRDQRIRHRKWARWTFPIWLYVSVTGVAIYWMLYQLYPAEVALATISLS